MTYSTTPAYNAIRRSRTSTNFNTNTLIDYISSIERDIHVFTPRTLRLQAPIPKYFKAGKAFYLYRLMISAVGMWPEAPPWALTQIRILVEAHGMIYAIRKAVGRYVTVDDYFSNIGEMATGSTAMLDEICLYMDRLFERLLGFLAPFFITSTSVQTQTLMHDNIYPATNWSNGNPETNWIIPEMQKYLRKYPLQAWAFPHLSTEMRVITATHTSRRMQALETLGDRVVDFLYELSLLSNRTSVPYDMRGSLKCIMLSNKMFSILGPALGMNWPMALPPIREPSDGMKIKLVADIFEARIGAIVSRRHGAFEVEEWWQQNMSHVIQHAASLLDTYRSPSRSTIGKRKRPDDSDRGSVKRARYSASDSSSSLRPQRDKEGESRRRAYQGKENRSHQSGSRVRNRRQYRY